MIHPELRKRFIDSIEYLRKMDFFKEYSDLTSEEILEKIFSGGIDYENRWLDEEEKEKNEKEYWKSMNKLKIKPHGVYLKEYAMEHGEKCMKWSDAEIDYNVACFDTKRMFIEHSETIVSRGICKMLMKKLSRISRGAFNPTDIREEIGEWKGRLPSELGRVYDQEGFIFKVFFRFRGKEHFVEFYTSADYLHLDPAIRKINELIKDTGYQYYGLYAEDLTYIVLSEEEAEKLKKERGWKIYLP